MNDTYVVKAGDTLYGISNQYGVSVTELASLNGVTADTLQIGQSLLIPIAGGSNPDNMFLYTVKKGDTLYAIARLYNVSVDSIKNLNYLTSNDLYIGQVLRIPEIYNKPEELSVPTYVNYTVQKGDSLYSIARKYQTSVDVLMQDNALKNTILSVGQNLKIRLEGEKNAYEECFGEEDSTSGDTYIVQVGDTLYSIARKYKTSVNDLMQLNQLKTIALKVGQVLQLPSSNSFYIVQKGDSLYSIAKKFQTTVESIKKKNQLQGNLLSVGQKLFI